MSHVLTLALVVAIFNTAVGVGLERLSRTAERFWWLQLTGFALRLTVIFGVAHLLWRTRRRAGEIAMFIIAAALGQLVGQVYFLQRKRASRIRG